MLIAALALATGAMAMTACTDGTPCHDIDVMANVHNITSAVCTFGSSQVPISLETGFEIPSNTLLLFPDTVGGDTFELWLRYTKDGANSVLLNSMTAVDSMAFDLATTKMGDFIEEIRAFGAELALVRQDGVELTGIIGVNGIQASAGDLTDKAARYPEIASLSSNTTDAGTTVSEAWMTPGLFNDADAAGFYRFVQQPTDTVMPGCKSKGGVFSTFLIGGLDDDAALTQHVHTSGDVSDVNALMATQGHYYGYQEFERNASSKTTEVGLLFDGGSFGVANVSDGVAFGGFYDCQAQLQFANDINGRSIVVHRGGSPRRLQGVVGRVDTDRDPAKYQVGALLFNGTVPVAHLQQTVFENGTLWKMTTVKTSALSEAAAPYTVWADGVELASVTVPVSDTQGASTSTVWTNASTPLVGHSLHLRHGNDTVAHGVMSSELNKLQHANVAETVCRVQPTPGADTDALPTALFFKKTGGRTDLTYTGVATPQTFVLGARGKHSVGMFQAATTANVGMTTAHSEIDMTRPYYDSLGLPGAVALPGSIVTLSQNNLVRGVCLVEKLAAHESFPVRPVMPSVTSNPVAAPTSVCPQYWAKRESDDRVRILSDEYEAGLLDVLADPTSPAAQQFFTDMGVKHQMQLGWQQTLLHAEVLGNCYALPAFLPSQCTSDSSIVKSIYEWRAANGDLEPQLQAVSGSATFLDTCDAPPPPPSAASTAASAAAVALAAAVAALRA